MIDWRTLSHSEFVTLLQEGLDERVRRIEEMRELTHDVAAAEEKRGPGRPRKDAALNGAGGAS